MRWQGEEESTNIEDRRGQGSGVPIIGGGIGLTLVAIIYALLGGNPQQVLDAGAQLQGRQAQQSGGTYVDDNPERTKFAKVILGDTERVWSKVFKEQLNRAYQPTTMVFFTGQTQTGCGTGDAGMGPFYCPSDAKVYIDLSFYDELKTKFGAPGEFAQAYVIAHEVGHHVQDLLGISGQVHAKQQAGNERQANALSVRMELQADFLAGVWAKNTDEMNHSIDPKDIDEALNAAHQIGDDVLQKKFQGQIVPDTFTHGSAEQRARWFKKGFESGQIADGDTFNARSL